MSKRRYLAILGFVVAAVLVSIALNATLVNHRPVITGMAAEPEAILLGGSCRIVCNASDRDKDQLGYNWSARWGGITGEGAVVTFTPPPAVGSYNVTVNVTDGRGGEATDYVTIRVKANQSPSITSLAANADWTTPSGSLRVTCNASDPDGDELSYEWTTDGGDISGAGAGINWTAPEPVGAYNVTVVVKDGYGGEDTREITLWVDRGAPPAIESLIVSPKGHIYLRDSTAAGCDYDVWIKREYSVECVVSNTSRELSFGWSCTAGNISGEGPTITWTAPNEKNVQVTVTVIASDIAGNGVAKSIVLHVPPCSCGSW